MHLLFEIGNSRVKWASCEERSLIDAAHASLSEDWQSRLNHWLDERADAGVATWQKVYWASVSGEGVNARLQSLIQSRLGCELNRIVAQAELLGLRNGYDDFAQLGVDRWLAMLAAWSQQSGEKNGPLCVVDAGTATTIDLIDPQGQHLGGLILPGFQLAQNMLEKQTAKIGLSEAPDKANFPFWATNTREAVTGGIRHATLALIEKALNSQDQEISLILTGGGAPALLDLATDRLARSTTHVTIRPNLVLEGLALLTQ